ncbi:MAG: hypothetical protein MJ138_08080, partial [Kiritimatiellae bacterium]|nr:hypothetical protein [Kiritimatiellia bacterium]
MKNRALVLLTTGVMVASFGAFAQAKSAAKPAAKPAVKAPAAAGAQAPKKQELSPEAVAAEKAFRDAIAAGEPLTAENHFRKLVEANPNPDPELYWLAAETARQSGKGAMRRDRLQNFLRQSKAWDAHAEQAAWELCLSANDCDQYLRLCSHMPPSTKLFKIGLEMLANYRRAKRTSDYLRITEGMLKTFTSEDARCTLLDRMAEMFRDKAPGFDVEKARKLAIDHPLKNMGRLAWTMDSTAELFDQKWRMEFCSKNKQLLSAGNFNWATRIEYDPKKNPQGRALWALYAKDLEKLCLDDKCDPRITLDWLRMRINLTTEFVPAAQTNKASKALADCFLRAARHEPKVNRGDLRQLMNDVANRKLLLGDEIADLRRKAPDCLDANLCTRWGGVCDLADKRTNVVSVMAFMKNNPDRFDVAWGSIGTLLKYAGSAANPPEYSEKAVLDKVLDILGEHVDRAACFDGNAVMNTLSDKRFETRRLDFLRKAYDRTGFNPTWGWLKNDKNNVNRWKWLKDDKGVATFVAAIDPKKTGSDKLLYLRGQMASLRRGAGNLAPEEAHKLMQQANAAYPGAYKNDGSRNSGNWHSIYMMYGDLCRHNSDSAAIMLANLKGKMSRDANWEYVNHALQHAWRGKGGALPHLQMTAERAAIFEDYGAFNDYAVPAEAIDKQTKQLSVKLDYAHTSPYTLKNFIWRNVRDRRFPAELTVQLVGDFYRNYKPGSFDPDWNRDMMDWAKSYSIKTNALSAKLPWEELAQHVLDVDQGRGDIARKFLYEMCWPAGKMEAMRARYMEKMKSFDAATYATELMNLGNGSIIRDGL